MRVGSEDDVEIDDGEPAGQENPAGWLGKSFPQLSPKKRKVPPPRTTTVAPPSAPRPVSPTPIKPPAPDAPNASVVVTQSKTSKPRPDILMLMDSPSLFGPWFTPRESWFPWRVVHAAAFALDPKRTGDEREARKLYEECTGRSKWPTEPADVVTLVIGARGGKSRNAALAATYLCCLREYEKYLAPGERGALPVVAADRKQARVVFNYASAFVSGSDIFAQLLETDPLKERLSFANNIDLEIMTASYRATRGYTNVGGILDEVAVYRSDETASPDAELFQSIKRGTLTIPGSMLWMISSPHARRGLLWDTYRKHFRVEGSSTLVWQAPTWVMNRSITRQDLDDEYERDPAKADADYGANFRKDVERFVDLDIIEACAARGYQELPPSNERSYGAFVDPSGGSQDSFTLAIGHREEDDVVIDCVREWLPPFGPDSVVAECAMVLKDYGLNFVVGDKYGGEWPTDRFNAHGITYEPSKLSKSDLYREMLPLMNSHRLHFPNLPRLKNQFWNLERRSTAAGKDTIDHPPGMHDDVCNAVAGAAEMLKEYFEFGLTW